MNSSAILTVRSWLMIFLFVIFAHACLIFYKKKYNKLKGTAQRILFFILISGSLFSSAAHFAYSAGERDAKNKLNYNKQLGYEILCTPRGEIKYKKNSPQR